MRKNKRNLDILKDASKSETNPYPFHKTDAFIFLPPSHSTDAD